MTTDEQARLDRLKMPDIGDMLDGRYRIQSVIATGGMGVILRAEQLPMKRAVAIKLLHPHVAAANPKIVGRFEQEVALAKLLNHPNTIRLYDFGESAEGLVYVAMEYLEGADLKRLLEQEGALSVGRTVDITVQILDGLAEAHARDFIHRDLKPSNVFITEDRRGDDLVKLLDFGIAKSLAGSDIDLTGSGAICGTPGYVSPEYLRNEPLQKASDLYAVGLMLLEMLIGRRVFKGESAVQTMMMHMQLDPDIPAAIEATPLADIIRKSTCKEPAERYVDADEMLQALEAIADELPSGLRLDDYASADASLDEDSNASIPAAEHTPASISLEASSGLKKLGPPPIPRPPKPAAAPPVPPRLEASSQVARDEETLDAAEPASDDFADEFFAAGADRRRLWMIGAAVAAVALVALVGLMLSDPGDVGARQDVASAKASQKTPAEVASDPGEPPSKPSAGGQEALAAADAAQGDTAPQDTAAAKIRFDVDTDPSGATVRVGERELGKTPLVYHVRAQELPQTLSFSLDGFQAKTAQLTEQSSPILVEELDKNVDKPAHDAPTHESGHRRHHTKKHAHSGASVSAKKKKGKISDKKVEQVLDKFLVE